MKYSSENFFLLRACDQGSGNCLNAILNDLPDSFDWTLLVQTALSHGVAGLLCQSLLNAEKRLVPGEIGYAANEYLTEQGNLNQKNADQLTAVLGVLEKSGIDAVPFKGPTLAISAYNDLSLRTFHDLDFLIRHSDIERCLVRLNELGYYHERNLTPRQWQEYLGYKEEDILFGPGLPLEPHWDFIPRTLAIDIDLEEIWQRVEIIEFNNQKILSLSPEDELIILCIHGNKELWHKLKWVVDVAAFVRSHPDLDWRSIFQRAEKQGILRVLNLGLLMASHLLNLQLPEIATQYQKHDRFVVGWSEKLANHFFVEKPPNNIWVPGYFHWSMRENLSDRFRYFIRTLFQPQEDFFNIVKIPDKFFFLYRPYRIIYYSIKLPYKALMNRLFSIDRK